LFTHFAMRTKKDVQKNYSQFLWEILWKNRIKVLKLIVKQRQRPSCT